MISPYNQEHFETFFTVREYLDRLSESQRRSILDQVRPYLAFRREVAAFQMETTDHDPTPFP